MNPNWLLFPLAFVISLVYTASRYESTETILRRSVRLFATIIGVMGLVFLVLWVLSRGL